MDPNDRHNDPLHEASGQAGQRLVQLTALAVTIRQLAVRLNLRRQLARYERNEAQQQAAREQERLEHAAARARWAVPYDKRWLREADVLATARAWNAAVPYAATDAAAAGAMQRCEERLRHLHPAAMRQYDRLRAEGLDPTEAMAQSVPHFAGHPDSHVGEPGPRRPAIRQPSGAPDEDLSGLWLIDYPKGLLPSKAEFLHQRDSRTAADLARRYRNEDAGRAAPRPEELRTLLETRTNIPSPAIEDAVPLSKRVTLRATSPDDAVALAAEDFPVSLNDTLSTSTASRPKTSAQPTASQRTPRTQRPHLGQ